VDGDDEISRLGIILNRTFDALEKSFAERESLFQEIRHRVKNNLQVVASLLSLQADDAENRETAIALQNSRRRVLAMAFVHEELYCSASLNSIDLHDYLERLAILIRHSLDPNGKIEFEIDAEKLELSIDRAVPFALIANEVLSNAFIHAFQDGKCETSASPKKVSLALREDADGNYMFTADDNGCGIGPLSEYKGTLGLILIDALSAQLISRYTYVTKQEGGTVFTLLFTKA
jgi:two-component sensor histidine kinase